MLLEMLSVEERYMIQDWIDMYGIANRDYNSVNTYKQASLDYILRAWDDDKHNLFKLLGNQLVVEKPVEFEKDADRVSAEIDVCLGTGDMHDFYLLLSDKYESSHSFFSREHGSFRTLFRSDCLRDNRYNRTAFCITASSTTPEGKKLKINVLPGTKVMKVLSKMAKFYGITEEFEKFRIAHSQILNTKKTKGILCLSIHPLDYMTMSDNSYDWDSCMSWENDGCYRQGTVEMMNSPYVLVAYLKGEKPFKIGPREWGGNKKWRELQVVHPGFICNIKGYPYRSDALSDLVLEWLKELAITNLGWKFDYGFQQFNYGDRFEYADEKSYSFNLDFFRMYNDFDTANTRHMIAVRSDYYDDDDYHTHYYDLSGANICMCCGDHWDPAEGREDMVFCWDCDPGPVCAECGENIYNPDDCYYVEGDYLCSECYHESAAWCAIDEERYYNSNLIQIHLAAIDNEVEFYDDLNSITVHKRYADKSGLVGTAMFTIDTVRSKIVDGKTIYYVNVSDCHKFALEDWFRIYSSVSLDMYRSRYETYYLDEVNDD